jgi:hypothetical protein
MRNGETDKMADQRLTEFRNRNKKENNMNAEFTAERLSRIEQIIYGLAAKTMRMEKKLNSSLAKIGLSYWRTLALMDVLAEEDKDSDFFKKIAERAETIQIKDFDDLSRIEDLEKKLLEVDADTVAENGMFAIFAVKCFKDKKEIETERIVRGKTELGRNEVWPELDENILGLKVGETKTFPLNLVGQTDEASVTLLGLRKRLPAPAKE